MLEVGGNPKAGYTIHKETNYNTVSSVGHRNSPSHTGITRQLSGWLAGWLGLAWLGLAWLGLAWLGLAWLGLAWLGLAWLGLAWLGLAGLGLAGLGLAWLGLTWLADEIQVNFENFRICCKSTYVFNILLYLTSVQHHYSSNNAFQ